MVCSIPKDSEQFTDRVLKATRCPPLNGAQHQGEAAQHQESTRLLRKGRTALQLDAQEGIWVERVELPSFAWRWASEILTVLRSESCSEPLKNCSGFKATRWVRVILLSLISTSVWSSICPSTTQCGMVHALGNACFTGLIKTLLVLTKNLLELKSFQHDKAAGAGNRTVEGLVNRLSIDFCWLISQD